MKPDNLAKEYPSELRSRSRSVDRHNMYQRRKAANDYEGVIVSLRLGERSHEVHSNAVPWNGRHWHRVEKTRRRASGGLGGLTSRAGSTKLLNVFLKFRPPIPLANVGTRAERSSMAQGGMSSIDNNLPKATVFKGAFRNAYNAWAVINLSDDQSLVAFEISKGVQGRYNFLSKVLVIFVSTLDGGEEFGGSS